MTITKFKPKLFNFPFLAASTADIEQFFLEDADQYIRQFFPPSFAFTEFDVNDKKR